MKFKLGYYIFILCLIFLSPVKIFAQFSDIVFEHFGTKDGLSHNIVRSILESKDGFLWVGTEDGLNKYDGKNFKIFRHIPNNKKSIQENFIKSIYEDNNQNIWIGSPSSVCLYNSTNEEFSPIPLDLENKKLFSSENAIYIDSVGDLWIVLDKKVFICKLDKNSKITSYRKIILPKQFFGPNVICEGLNNQIYVGFSDGGVLQIDKNTLHVFSINQLIKNKNEAELNNIIRAIYNDSKDDLWIGTFNRGLILYNKKTKKFEKFYFKTPKSLEESRSVNTIRAICEQTFLNGEKYFWIGTYDAGLGLFNRKSKTFTFFKKNPENNNSISNNFITALFDDKKGTLWIGTGYGLNKFDIYRQQVKTLNIPLIGDEPRRNTVENVLLDKNYFINNIIWYSTDGNGLFKFNRQTKKWKQYINIPKIKKSLSTNYIYGLHQDEKGMIWLATIEGLVKFNPESEVFEKQFAVNDINFSKYDFRDIKKYSKSTFLLSSSTEGVLFFNYVNKKVKTISFKRLDGKFEKIKFPSAGLTIDNQKNIWCCSGTSGVFKIKNGENFYSETIDVRKGMLKSNVVHHVFFDEFRDVLWICTTNGLCEYNILDKKFKNFDVESGFPNSDIFDIKVDKNKLLWVVTANGMIALNPEKNQLRVYDENDGLFINRRRINLDTSLTSEFFIGQEGAINYFNPESFLINKNIPKIAITSFKIFETPILIKPFINTGKILNLNYNQNFLQIEFSVLNYTNPKKNKFAFKLDGYNSNWLNANGGKINFTNLESGKYKLLLKGANNEGFWNDKPIILNFEIFPPFWKTWWFYVGSLVAIGGYIYYWVLLRIKTIRKNLEKENEIKVAITNLKVQALQSQMNPHFIFNCMNSIQGNILNKDYASAIEYLNRFSKLLRQVLENSDKSFISLNDEIESLKIYIDLEFLRLPLKNEILFEIDPNLELEFIKIPSFILQPFIENSILHGIRHSKKEGLIKISISPFNNLIYIRIEDNGIGRKKSAEINSNRINHKSKGLRIIDERIQIFKNQYKNDNIKIFFEDKMNFNNEVVGTIVNLYLPTLHD